jgi:hypothetical protein
VAVAALVLMLGGIVAGAIYFARRDTSRAVSIVGTWRMVEEGPAGPRFEGTIEFTRDGRVNVSLGGVDMPARYRWVDERHIEIDSGGQKEINEVISVNKQKLTLKDPRGRRVVLTRLK